jgi:hypothetical protein
MNQPLNRTPLVLACIGAWLASAYWVALTLLIVLGVTAGSLAAAQLILPCILIVLYALRGFRMLKGDPAAATSLLWLHAIGGIMAILQLSSPLRSVVVLYSIKIAIHVFGGATAFLAKRALSEQRSSAA